MTHRKMSKRIPRGWTWTTLGEICDINPRATSTLTLDVEVSFVPMAAVEEETGRLDGSTVRTVRAVRKGYTPFEENDVLFAKITPCMENGKIALATDLRNGVGFGSTEFVVFRPLGGVLPRYVLYFLIQPAFRRSAQRQMTGVVGQKRVPTNWLAKHAIPLPPIREQQEIVSRLDRLFAKTERGETALARAQERLSRYRRAVIDSAISGELTKSWRGDQDLTESSDRYLDQLRVSRRKRWEQAELLRQKKKGQRPKTESWKNKYEPASLPRADVVEEIPTGWALSTISELSWSAGYGTSVKCSFDGNGPPVLRIPNVHDRIIDLDDLKYVTDTASFDESNFIQAGDFLIVRTNGTKKLIGRGAVVLRNPKKPTGFASYLIRYRLLGSAITWRWLSLAWDSGVVRDQIESKALTTAGQYNVSLSRLEDTTIPTPPVAEQRAIVSAVTVRLKDADKLEKRLTTSQAHAKQQREAVLANAFSGRLSRRAPDDEPVDHILKRIRETRAERELRKPSKRDLKISEPIAMTSEGLLKKIRQHFGRKPFTFADLQNTFSRENYENLKGEVFRLTEEHENTLRSQSLRVTFNEDSGELEFQLHQK